MNYELEATVMYLNTSLLLHHPSGCNPAQTSHGDFPITMGHHHYIKILNVYECECVCVCVCVCV